jgi:hypothetical protein
MTALIAVLAVLLGAGSLAQKSTEPPLPRVERLCGKLQHVRDIPEKKNSRTLIQKTTNLSSAVVSLYPFDEKGNCCEMISALEKTITGRWGSFHLKENGLARGTYWLVAEAGGRQYKMLIQFVPQRNSIKPCSEIYWQVTDEGQFWITETIVID